MKYSLTITSDNPSELAKLLAHLGGTTAVATYAPSPMPSVPTNTGHEDDDENGDTIAAAGTVDKNGLPWDDRIHSTPAKLTAKGVWRAKRGVNPALVTQVEAELRARPAIPADAGTAGPAAMAATAPAPMPMPAQPQFTPPANVPMPGAPVMQQPAPMPMPSPMPAPVPVQQPAPQPVQPPQATGPLDFNGFMQKIQVLLQQKDANGAPLIDAPYLSTVAQRVGAAFNVPCNSITDLSANQQWIDYAVQIMQHEQRWI